MDNFCKCGCGKKIRPKSTWAKGHNANKNYDRFDWSNLKSDYERLGNTVEIAKMYGCTHEAVSYQMVKRGIKVNEKRLEIANVVELYEEHKSATKIAKILGCSSNTVRERLYEKGVVLNHDNKGLDVEVGTGRFGEKIAMLLLENSLDMNKATVHAAYDLEWNGMKIDVKTSNTLKMSNRRGLNYAFSTKNKNCTHYILIPLDANKMPIDIFLIPSKDIEKNSITFTVNTIKKYKKYSMGFDNETLRKAAQNAKN